MLASGETVEDRTFAHGWERDQPDDDPQHHNMWKVSGAPCGATLPSALILEPTLFHLSL